MYRRGRIKRPRVCYTTKLLLPTGALDSKTGDDIMKVLKSLHQMGKTIIIVTHNMEIAHQADRILKMEDGKITEY